MRMQFENHPDHRRILLPDDWEGYPLRKDYEVQSFTTGLGALPPMIRRAWVWKCTVTKMTKPARL